MSDRDMGIVDLDGLMVSYALKDTVGEGSILQSIRLSSRRQCSGHPINIHLMRNR